MSDNTSIRVAVRVRPLLINELSKGSKEIIEVITQNDQLLVKYLEKDTPYTFDYVFPNTSIENDVYNKCVKHLIENLYKVCNFFFLILFYRIIQ